MKAASVRASTPARYPLEEYLVLDLLDVLQGSAQPWGELALIREFDFRSGRTDVLGRTSSSDLLALEVKLTRWRDAAQQAYRNTIFANYALVVVPEEVATSIRDKSFLEARGVGLCHLSGGALIIDVLPRRHEPLNPWLHRRALDMIEADGTGPGSSRSDCARHLREEALSA